MSATAYFAADLVAIALLAIGLYYRRHQRHDLMLAYVALNIGVLGVTTALDRGASAGLGFGLFGVLSIIRLRSIELSQEEVAYYFVSLAIGLLAGLRLQPGWLGLGLMALLVVVMGVFDHPFVRGRSLRQEMILDAAFPREADARAHLEVLLDADVRRVRISRVDMVKETTEVDVCFRPRRRSDRQVTGSSVTADPAGLGGPVR